MTLSATLTGVERLRYQAEVNAAQATGRGGSSGGVGFAAGPATGLSPVELPDAIALPDGSRAIFRHWGGVASGGVIVLSLYLVSGQGLKDANTKLLEQVGLVLKAIDRPCIVGGDFQMEKKALEQSGWPEAMGAVVFAPSAYTCVSSRSASIIDVFVVSQDIAGMVVSVETRTHVTDIRPHKPVRIVFEGAQKLEWVKKVHRPKAFPSTLPYGPAPEPNHVGWQAAHEVLDAAKDAQGVEQAFIDVIKLAEVGVADAFGIHEGRQRYLGREKCAEVVWQRQRDEKGVANYPRGTAVSRTRRCIGERLDEFVHVRFRALGQIGGRISHCKGILRALAFTRLPVGMEQDEALSRAWDWWRGQLYELDPENQQAVATLAGQVRARAKRIEDGLARKRAILWCNWARRTAMANGARLAHRWVNGPLEWVDDAPPGHPLSVQESADARAGKWHGH